MVMSRVVYLDSTYIFTYPHRFHVRLYTVHTFGSTYSKLRRTANTFPLFDHDFKAAHGVTLTRCDITPTAMPPQGHECFASGIAETVPDLQPVCRTSQPRECHLPLIIHSRRDSIEVGHDREQMQLPQGPGEQHDEAQCDHCRL